MPSSRGQQPTPSSSLINNATSTSSSSSANNWRLTVTPQISGNASWKTNNRMIPTPRTFPPPPQTITQIRMYCWLKIVLFSEIRIRIFTEQIRRKKENDRCNAENKICVMNKTIIGRV
jgi:hypothetical protein